ncbi:MAG: hypothetical protein KatS3mg115_0745 [Candidatus Poribacteria bacterium]|nr:MAG: hypothetical protein KatS3mg115_0745 [Candidatus Poribacteria bacterium]
MRPVENHYVTRFEAFRPSSYRVGGKKVGFGIDLDGCIDMGMEKHCLAFGVATCIHYGMQPIQNVALKAWMYANFYSLSRGITRFKALYLWADIVRETRAARSLGLTVPQFKYLRRWTEITSAFSPEALRSYLDRGDLSAVLDAGDDPEDARAELEDVLAWSDAVNARVPEATAHMTAFPNAVRFIQDAYQQGVDIAIVSGTPEDHVKHQVEAYGISGCLEALWAQQAGKKHHALVTMMVGAVSDREIQEAIEQERPLLESRPAQYDVLVMVGDAPQDNRERIRANLALSGREDEPIRMFLIPVEEENDAWGELHKNLGAILDGSWSREDETRRIAAGLRKLDVEWVETPVYYFKQKASS